MSLQPGQQIGDYQVLEVLGAGGMGQVYKVRNVISDRTEAMKVLLPDLQQDPGLADRFLREIKVQASLEHPNIARLHTAMRADNQLLMLMEFVEGQTLDKFIEQGQPMPLGHAVWYCTQVLHALEYAHARGIVHRDIKPANMMLTATGELKLLDFGIARVMNDPSLTQTRQTIGSLYYMSPEQINGQNVDARSDLYSLGVSLYQMVTGRKPFDGTSDFSIMAAHLQQAAIPPMQMDPRMPQSLNDVILTAITKDTAARFQSAAAFRGALEVTLQELQGQPAAATPAFAPEAVTLPAPTPVPSTPGGGGPRLGMMLGVAAVFLVLFAAGTFAFLRWRRQAGQEVEIGQTKPNYVPPQPGGSEPAPLPQKDPDPPPVPVPSSGSEAPPSRKEQPPRQENYAAAPSAAKRSGEAPPQHAARAAVQTQPETAPSTQKGPESAPVSTPNVPVPVPETPRVDPALARELRTRRVRIEARLESCKSALANLKETLAKQGLKPRGELQVWLQTVTSELAEGEAALQLGSGEDAKQHFETAEQTLRRVEKSFNL